jgi:hypothetical protein
MRLYGWGFIILILMSVIGHMGAQDQVTIPDLASEWVETTYNVPEGEVVNLFDIAIRFNICLTSLVASNERAFSQNTSLPELYSHLLDHPSQAKQYMFFHSEGVKLSIPAHKSCYISVDTQNRTLLSQIEKEYNICIEEFYGLIHSSEDSKQIAYLPQDAPPCVNNKGQRLLYTQDQTDWVDEWHVGDYQDSPLINAPEDVLTLRYCLGDLKRANPAVALPYEDSNRPGRVHFTWTLRGFPYMAGIRLFVPEGIRHCDFVQTQESLYSLSQQYNVCMEVILDASGMPLYPDHSEGILHSIPLDKTPCYDVHGQRLNVPEEMVYKPQAGESFLDIAQKYNICMDSLWDANPVMDYWDGASYRMPDVIFIPHVKPCEFTRTLTSRSNMSLLGLATLTNICRNQIDKVNPHLGLSEADPQETYRFAEKIAAGKTIIIPERPPCYRLLSQESIEQIHYVCYVVPVTSESDFTGHIPPVNMSLQGDLPYCYEITEDMTVFYENTPYSLYNRRDYGYSNDIADCHGIEQGLMAQLNEDKPWHMEGYFLIPQPHKECDIEAYRDLARKRYQEQTYLAGYLIDGIYRVNYDDTLSSISRKYGYLPQWIADANGISLSDPIYFLQELKMPPYPSLYTLLPAGGAAGVIVLASGAIYGLRRWLRQRNQGKKKNS